MSVTPYISKAGAQGFQGTQGFQGFQGTQGFQGYQGDQGFQGDTGPSGEDISLLKNIFLGSYQGNRLTSTDPTSNGFHVEKNANEATGFSVNNVNTGNGAIAHFVARGTSTAYSNAISMQYFNSGYYVSSLRDTGAIFSTNKLNFISINNNPINLMTGSGIDSATPRVTILGDGNVGIGTTAPLYPFEVQSNGFTQVLFKGTEQTRSSELLILNNLNRGLNINVTGSNYGSGTQNQIRLSPQGTGMQTISIGAARGAGTPAFTVNVSTGNVGIGTTSPTSKLEVVGNITATTYNDYIPLPTEAATSTGVTISFVTDTLYGKLDTPETGNLTANVTGAKLGVNSTIIHNSSTVPTFSSEFKKLSGSGSYITGVINYIFCLYISSTEIIYSINQRT